MSVEPDAYREAFLTEARAGLEAMNAALVRAERERDNAELVKEVFRAVHTIKGMAATLRYERLVARCHEIENTLDRIRNGGAPLADSVDDLFRAFDGLERHIAEIAAKAPSGEPQAHAPTLPVRVDRLDILMNLAEELIVAKLRFDDLREAARDPQLASAVDSLDRLVSELQYQVTQARMAPLGLIFTRFPRLVRDLAKKQGKEIELVMKGGDIELDRAVAEEVGESLIHLLRNAVDHGIETSAERTKKHKPPLGTIFVAASRTKGMASIVVEDDGAGLDIAALRAAAAARGALPADATDEDVVKLVFSGLSTVREATPVSGRGLGLDIAYRKMRALGGNLSVSSTSGRGTAFRMDVPLSLAIIKALFVEVGGRMFAIPLSGVERILTAGKDSVERVLRDEAVVFQSTDVRLLRLRSMFHLPETGAERFPVVVVAQDGARLGLVVDGLANTQEIVVKPLNRLLSDSRYFSGSALVGTGKPVLVLDVPGLMRVASGAPA